MPQHRLKPEDFIRRCTEEHKGRYDYSKTKFEVTRGLVEIICPIHGSFWQIANLHLCKRTGCPECKLGVRKTTDKFIKDSLKVHGDKFDYSLVEYVRKQDAVSIVCPSHGKFQQRPSDHLAGSTCPSCAEYGYNSMKSANLYILNSNGFGTKIGITNRDVIDRLSAINRSANKIGASFEISYVHNTDGLYARKLEKDLHNWANTNYINPTIKFDGYTETFVGLCVIEAKLKLMEIIKDDESKVDCCNTTSG